jgi:hypothetical protein
LGNALDKAHEGGSSGIHRAEGLFLKVALTAHVSSIFPCLEQKYMQEMVEARRNTDKAEERYDLFSGLLDAAQGGSDDEAIITEEEVIGKYDVY